ncbi:MAG: ATP synthase F1 subunit gamma [Candidatus Ryanbacteria bacterium RIFCSPHIGHO2_02_FULL_48_12]|uniref:ATP synthase gamma chain n=1 Tax=Candidatus Ryanbacteria bacterium RIFCSPHIGHO2_01_FULL_48_27 TaxID=1802115 RepID=A0A1G2G7F6_9BACT|nr:MAG: ATP synthase F1 subunit gamma [Candidatus Ryanbacteria bacterium RIFCSPHIGHO2_01_FULL_48_27]OGZ49425.1 MAG: ATP synthase F1 subunit gamma [Candidatus Ryanbacteria bacterium RIFCSPHIGHO2_02_FULL_48_12]
MESLQNIKRRIKSVKNIEQITKAMELVSATKMRRSQEVALATRPYVFTALEMLRNISQSVGEGELPALLVHRAVQRTAYVVVASDKGLSGSFNASVFRAFDAFLASRQVDVSSESSIFVAVGEKARLHLKKRTQRVDRSFIHFGDYTNLEEIIPLSEYLVSGYLEGKWDKVVVFYMSFRSALRQEVLLREILPVDPEALERIAKEIIPESGRFAEILKEQGVSFFAGAPQKDAEYIIEPSPVRALELLLPHLVVTEIYHIVLEANASEHSARRVAMKSASDNASDIGGRLTLEYNKSRQAAITRELTEITAGAESIQ